MKTDFKIGDRVIAVKERTPLGTLVTLNKGATVMKVEEGADEKVVLGLRFDENIGGHDLDGLVEDGHGLYVYSDYVEIYQPIDLKQFKICLEETVMNLEDIEKVLLNTTLVPCLCHVDAVEGFKDCEGCKAHCTMNEVLLEVRFLLEQVENTLKRSVNNGDLS